MFVKLGYLVKFQTVYICLLAFTIIRYDRHGRNDGVALMIKNSIRYRVIEIPAEFINIEIVCVDNFLGFGTCRLIVYYNSRGSLLLIVLPIVFAVSIFYVLLNIAFVCWVTSIYLTLTGTITPSLTTPYTISSWSLSTT